MAKAAILDQLKQHFGGWTGQLEIRSDGPEGIVLGHLAQKQRPRGEFLTIQCEQPVDGVSEGLSGEPSTIVTLRLAFCSRVISSFRFQEDGVAAVPKDVPECAQIERNPMEDSLTFMWPAITIDQEQYERLFDEDWFVPVATHGPDREITSTPPSAIDIAKRLGEETRKKANLLSAAAYAPNFDITPDRPVAATSGILASMGSSIIQPRSLLTMKTTA